MENLPEQLRYMNFSFLVEGEVAGMSGPGPNTYEALKKVGIKGVVSLTHSYRPPAAALEIAYLHEPVIDFTAPGIDQVQNVIDFIRGSRPVAVHCAAGYGRTGTMLACYLVAEQRMTAKEAIQTVRSKRPGSIETFDQEDLIHAYAETLGNRDES